MADNIKVKNVKLEKRILGKSELEVSKLCFGTLSLSVYHANLSPEKASDLLIEAYNLGINFWDTSELYETYEHINLALKRLNYPNDIVISSRSYARTYEDMKTSINNCLNKLKIKQVPIFGLHEVQKDEFQNSYFRPEAMRALIEARQNGQIKAISVTTHSAEVVKKSANIEEIDVIMPLINHKGIGIKDGSLKDMEKAIKIAKSNNKGIFAMKVLAGGCLTEDVKRAVGYVSENPDIDSIAIGMDSREELLFNISLFSGIQSYLDLDKKINSRKKYLLIEPWCIGCQNCIKACPQNALVLEYGQAKVIDEKCIRCGYCISACKDFYIKFLSK